MIYENDCFPPAKLPGTELSKPNWTNSYTGFHSGIFKYNLQGKCFQKFFRYLISDPAILAFIKNSEEGAPSSILLPSSIKELPFSFCQGTVCVWNSFLWGVIESNTMTEKGTVIHNAGNKCEPRLQGQSNLMLQERKWSFARSGRNFLFSSNRKYQTTWQRGCGGGEIHLGSEIQSIHDTTYTKKINGVGYVGGWSCVKSLYPVFSITQWDTHLTRFYHVPW